MEQDPKQKDTNTQKDTAKGHAGGAITHSPGNYTQAMHRCMDAHAHAHRYMQAQVPTRAWMAGWVFPLTS